MESRGIGYLIKSINDKLKVKADESLKDSGLTFSQSRVLAYLNMHDGQATQKEIEDDLGVSHPTVVGIVSRMEQNGFLTTWFDTKQQRSKMVALTEKAMTVGADMDAAIQLQETELLDGLTQEEADVLERALTSIYQKLK